MSAHVSSRTADYCSLVLRYLALLAALWMLASCSSSTAAPASATVHANCAPVGARTIAIGSRAEVYSRSHAVYGCATGGGHYRLGGVGRCVGSHVVEAVALTARVVAYALSSCGVDMSTTEVIVRRLTDGAKLSSNAAVTHLTGPESIQSVNAIVVSPAGRAAWIGTSHSIIGHRKTTEVLAQTAGGVRLLDSDAGIRPSSLRLTGARLTWTDSSGARSAILR
jgi:hypothetical protein